MKDIVPQKHCPCCNRDFPATVEIFGKYSSSKDGLRRICKSCRRAEYSSHPERNQEVIQKRREALLAKSPEEREEFYAHLNENYRKRAANRRQAGMCSSCIIRPAESGRAVCDRCYARHKLYGDTLRDLVVTTYGGVCAVCGETNVAFLSVDHISNDGAEHRREVGQGHRFYLWLRKNHFPQEGFQLLCANCNWRKRVDSQSDPFSQKAIYMKNWYASLRSETFAAYGGECICCGESQIDVLTIDHVKNDGAQHRRLIGGGSRLYAWLRKNGFPQDGFQILCFNCNRAKFYYGVCPHQQ